MVDDSDRAAASPESLPSDGALAYEFPGSPEGHVSSAAGCRGTAGHC